MTIVLNGTTGITAPGVETFGNGTALGGTTNPIVAMTGASTNYVQAYAVNNTNGTSSSADLVAYPSNGTDSHGWVDMGITSQSYADTTYTVTGPNESYLFASAPSGSSTTGNLVIATDNTGTSNSIQFYTNGFTQAKSAAKMVIDGATGNVGIGTSSPDAASKITSVATATQVGFASYNAGTAGYPAFGFVGQVTSNGGRGAGMYLPADGTLAWSTAGSERMRIDSSGNLLVGTTSQIGSGRVNVLATSATNGIICQQVNNGNTVFSGFNAAGSTTFYVVGGGQIYSTSTSIAAISDQSQKENVVDIPYGLTTIQQLRPVKFDFKKGCASEEKDLLGFIAQEVENVIPELVKPFGEDGLLGLKMGDMLPVLVKAIQELNATITDLQAKLKSAGVAGF